MNDAERRVFAAGSALILDLEEQLEHANANVADLKARLADVLGTGPEVGEVDFVRCQAHRGSINDGQCFDELGHDGPHVFGKKPGRCGIHFGGHHGDRCIHSKDHEGPHEF